MNTITQTKPKKKLSAFFDQFNDRNLETANNADIKAHSNLVSALIRSSIPRYSFKNSDELADYKTEKFHDILNRFIEAGNTFDVSGDDFQVNDGSNKLKDSDRDFLRLNAESVLCHLQQSLLMKHLFSHSPEQFEDFAFEIMERESIMSETLELNYDLYCAVVRDVTQIWFERLLNE